MEYIITIGIIVNFPIICHLIFKAYCIRIISKVSIEKANEINNFNIKANQSFLPLAKIIPKVFKRNIKNNNDLNSDKENIS